MWAGVGGTRNGRFFEGGEGPNSQLFYPIRVYIISGRIGGGGGGVEFLIIFNPSAHHTFKWNDPIICTYDKFCPFLDHYKPGVRPL